MTREEIRNAMEELLQIAVNTKQGSIDKIQLYITRMDEPILFWPAHPHRYTEIIGNEDCETGYQRKIIRSRISEIDKEQVSWCDIEIPVVFGNYPRRPCLDLLGHVNGNKLVICELKYGRNGDNPLIAGAQILFYYYMILSNIENFEVNNILHTNAINQKNIHWEFANDNDRIETLVVANQNYWQKYAGENWFRNQNARHSRTAILNVFSSLGVKFYKAVENLDNTFTWTRIN
ncbi:MAG: hypothetical protein WCJ95_17740 [Mariniphaga sp.]